MWFSRLNDFAPGATDPCLMLPTMTQVSADPEEFASTPDFVDEPTVRRNICMKHGPIVKGSDRFLVRLPVIGTCDECPVELSLDDLEEVR